MSISLQDISPTQFNFIQRTYGVLLIALIAMTLLGVFSYTTLPQASRMPLLILDTLIWIACGWFGLRNPIKAVFPVFLLITGLFLGQVAHLYRPDMFLAAALMTLAIFGAVSGYVLYTKKDFTFLGGALNIGFFILIAMMLLLFIFKISILSLILGLFGTAVFIGWILYDTSQILYRADETGYTAQHAAFDLFMDIIGLFSFVRSLFGYFSDED